MSPSHTHMHINFYADHAKLGEYHMIHVTWNTTNKTLPTIQSLDEPNRISTAARHVSYEARREMAWQQKTHQMACSTRKSVRTAKQATILLQRKSFVWQIFAYFHCMRPMGDIGQQLYVHHALGSYTAERGKAKKTDTPNGWRMKRKWIDPRFETNKWMFSSPMAGFFHRQFASVNFVMLAMAGTGYCLLFLEKGSSAAARNGADEHYCRMSWTNKKNRAQN